MVNAAVCLMRAQVDEANLPKFGLAQLCANP